MVKFWVNVVNLHGGLLSEGEREEIVRFKECNDEEGEVMITREETPMHIYQEEAQGN